MKKHAYTKRELEALLAAHGVRRCHVCGVFEQPRQMPDGIGGIQSSDMGKNSQGLNVHAGCARKLR
jgi:hypothetical protein